MPQSQRRQKWKKYLEEEGKTRHDIGREAFMARPHINSRKKAMTRSLRKTKKMGSSLIGRARHTLLDEKWTIAVRAAFKPMLDDGLIYRGHRIVNWCPHCSSNTSDDEVEHKRKKRLSLYFQIREAISLPHSHHAPGNKTLRHGSRREPGSDERYKTYIGQTFTVDLGRGPQKLPSSPMKKSIRAYGTGALGVTPAHPATDIRSPKNDLPFIQVINESG